MSPLDDEVSDPTFLEAQNFEGRVALRVVRLVFLSAVGFWRESFGFLAPRSLSSEESVSPVKLDLGRKFPVVFLAGSPFLRCNGFLGESVRAFPIFLGLALCAAVSVIVILAVFRAGDFGSAAEDSALVMVGRCLGLGKLVQKRRRGLSSPRFGLFGSTYFSNGPLSPCASEKVEFA